MSVSASDFASGNSGEGGVAYARLEGAKRYLHTIRLLQDSTIEYGGGGAIASVECALPLFDPQCFAHKEEAVAVVALAKECTR